MMVNIISSNVKTPSVIRGVKPANDAFPLWYLRAQHGGADAIFQCDDNKKAQA